MMECNCRSHVRDFSETKGGKYPPSYHAPSCSHYKPILFKRFIVDGAIVVDTPDNIKKIAKSFDDAFEGSYKVLDVYLTQDQFDAMHEFEGF